MARVCTVRMKEFSEDGSGLKLTLPKIGTHLRHQPFLRDRIGIKPITIGFNGGHFPPNSTRLLGFTSSKWPNITQPCGALGQSRDQQPSNWLTNKQTLNLRKCNESRLGYAAGHFNNNAEVLFGHMTIAEYVPQQSTSMFVSSSSSGLLDKL